MRFIVSGIYVLHFLKFYIKEKRYLEPALFLQISKTDSIFSRHSSEVYFY